MAARNFDPASARRLQALLPAARRRGRKPCSEQADYLAALKALEAVAE
jgi:hypothetical protein